MSGSDASEEGSQWDPSGREQSVYWGVTAPVMTANFTGAPAVCETAGVLWACQLPLASPQPWSEELLSGPVFLRHQEVQ